MHTALYLSRNVPVNLYATDNCVYDMDILWHDFPTAKSSIQFAQRWHIPIHIWKGWRYWNHDSCASKMLQTSHQRPQGSIESELHVEGPVPEQMYWLMKMAWKNGANIHALGKRYVLSTYLFQEGQFFECAETVVGLHCFKVCMAVFLATSAPERVHHGDWNTWQKKSHFSKTLSGLNLLLNSTSCW